MNIKERYFEHANAISRAGLGMKNFPTLKELWEDADEREKKKKEKRKRKKGGGSCNAYFCIGFSQLWREKIHSVIKRLQNVHDLKWLRVRMSYHRFPNLGEVLQGDMVGKLRKGTGSKDFLDRE